MKFSQIDDCDKAIKQRLATVLKEWTVPAGAQLYLFGSCARGEAQPGSDIDIALVTDAELDPFAIADLYDYYEDGKPFPVNVTEFSAAAIRNEYHKIHKTIKREAIEWQLLPMLITQ